MNDKKFKIAVGILGVVNLILFLVCPDRNMLNGIIGECLLLNRCCYLIK